MGLGFVALRGRIAPAHFHPSRKAGENWARVVGTCLVAAGLGHLLVYSVVLHNPLWFPQAVGSWPFVNLLPVVLALAFVALKVADGWSRRIADGGSSEEHTSELQSLMLKSYAVFCWQKKKHVV